MGSRRFLEDDASFVIVGVHGAKLLSAECALAPQFESTADFISHWVEKLRVIECPLHGPLRSVK